MYDDDEIQEQDKKSLLKEMSKKGISKIIETVPLKTKLIIAGIIFGIVFFLLIFIVLSVPMFMFFFNDDSGSSSDSNLAYIDGNAEDNYWWPIGGTEIEEKDGVEYATGSPSCTVISSPFTSSRVLDGQEEKHYGLDIGCIGHVISTAKGTVYAKNDSCDNNGNLQNTCGGQLGNYVIIEHPGSIYIVYAHLLPDSISVSVGDVVEQGQIIGHTGNSGRSTGPHLHFQIEVGGRGSNYAVNPLEYISTENPRPVTVQSGTSEITGDNQMIKMLQSWEGTGPTSGDNYLVYNDGYGYLTVGHGVTLKYNAERFNARGINVSSLSVNSQIKKSIVDSIEQEIVKEKRESVLSLLANHNITLEEHQIDALVIRIYNVGNINYFPRNYKAYGNSQDLYDNFMSKPVTSNGEYSLGLARRRQAEWKLFHEGIYTLNY